MPSRPKIHRPPGSCRAAPAPRPSAHERGYSARWARFAKAFLESHPECFYCGILGLGPVPSAHADHWIPCEPDSPDFFDPELIRPACRFHNSGKRDVPGPEYVRRLLADAGLTAPIIDADDDEKFPWR
jgi:hypothetical protein